MDNLIAILESINMNLTIPWEAIITIVLFMIVHLCGTVWWASKIQTTLQILNNTVDSISKVMAMHEAKYYSKEEAAKDFAYRDQQIEAIWKRVDSYNGNGH